MLNFKKKILKNPIADELYRKLLKICNDDEYALCLVHDLNDNNQYRELINLIDHGVTNTNDLIYYALKISGTKSIPVSDLKERDF